MQRVELKVSAQVALEEAEAAVRGLVGGRVDGVDVPNRVIEGRHVRWFGTLGIRMSVEPLGDGAALSIEIEGSWPRRPGAFARALAEEVARGAENRRARREAGL